MQILIILFKSRELNVRYFDQVYYINTVVYSLFTLLFASDFTNYFKQI